MNIGLFFGSFNPIHTGHLIIANYFRQSIPFQQVWFIVSPQNPLKLSESLLNEYHRLALVQLAIEDEPGLTVSDIEFKLPRPSFTIDTITYLREKYPNHTFSLIIGSDSYQNLPAWKNFPVLIKICPIYVYTRTGFEKRQSYENSDTQFFKVPLIEISSTHIRKMIKEGKSIRFLVPDKVKDEIDRNGYYR